MKVRLPAVCNCQGYLRVRQARCALSFPIHHSLSPLCVHPPLSSHDPLPSFSASSPLLFLLLSLTPVLLLHPSSLYFSSSPSHLSSSCFSYHFASHPRGDGEQWIYSNAGMVKGEQGFKKKHWHGLYYHQLLSTSQLCPQCPSLSV